MTLGIKNIAERWADGGNAAETAETNEQPAVACGSTLAADEAALARLDDQLATLNAELDSLRQSSVAASIDMANDVPGAGDKFDGLVDQQKAVSIRRDAVSQAKAEVEQRIAKAQAAIEAEQQREAREQKRKAITEAHEKLVAVAKHADDTITELLAARDAFVEATREVVGAVGRRTPDLGAATDKDPGGTVDRALELRGTPYNRRRHRENVLPNGLFLHKTLVPLSFFIEQAGLSEGD